MKKSAGILSYRKVNDTIEVFLVHPGGPFWKNKEQGAWSIPKGEFSDNEDPFDAAKREFLEEVGTRCDGNFLQLTPIRQKSGKWIYVWAVEQDIDPKETKSNLFQLEWPPGSGQLSEFPEVDKSAWFSIADATLKLNPAQVSFINELITILKLSVPINI